jgi:hypothetical protein
LTDFVDVSIDLFTAALAVGTGAFATLIRRKFAGGALWKPWRVLAASPFVLAAAEVNHIYEDFVGSNTLADSLHVILEAGFVLALFYGFYLIYVASVPLSDEGE